jgi:phospholipid/cholesterol/gamma-HCH transport system substrate-binding protein
MKWSNESRVGLAVFAALIVFVGGVIFLRGIDLRSKQYSLAVLYRNVNGLKAGDMVTVAGLSIGQVESMTLAGSSVKVDLSIQTNVRLPRDSRAVVKSETIMGGKFIEITPGLSPVMLKNGDSLSGFYEADLSELTSTLAPISSNILGILENVNTTFDEPTRKRVQDIIRELEQSTARLEEVIRSSGPRADRAVDDFSAFSRDMSRFARTLDTIALHQKGNIDTGMTDFRTTASNLSRVSAEMEKSTEMLNAVLAKMKNGEGTLGKLTQDERLYNDLDSLSVNLNRLVIDIKENPARYVRVSLF